MTLQLANLVAATGCSKDVGAAFLGPINTISPKWGIITAKRLAHFLAQAAHESARFTRLQENLNYSSEGLLSTFPKYFASIEVAREYHRQPEKIANRVYANRMGNGDEASGDGWR